MFQFALRRITIFPLTLLIANFIGFAFAFSTAPIVTASDPYSFGTNKLPPVMPAYLIICKMYSKVILAVRLPMNRSLRPFQDLVLPASG